MKKSVLIVLLLCLFTSVWAQKNLSLNEIKDIHSDYLEIFKNYTKEIKNESKSVVFVQIGNFSNKEPLSLTEEILDNTFLFMRLVSAVENTDEVFEKNEFGGMPILGYINLGPVDFILYSGLEMKVLLGNTIRKIYFNDYDLQGHPIYVWEIIKYRGSYYKRIDM